MYSVDSQELIFLRIQIRKPLLSLPHYETDSIHVYHVYHSCTLHSYDHSPLVWSYISAFQSNHRSASRSGSVWRNTAWACRHAYTTHQAMMCFQSAFRDVGSSVVVWQKEAEQSVRVYNSFRFAPFLKLNSDVGFRQSLIIR